MSKQFQIDNDMIEGSDGASNVTEAVAELVAEIFDEVDLDGDRRISFSEFCQSKILRSEVERLARHSVSFFTQPEPH